MKTIFYAAPLMLSSSVAMSHESGQLHAHLDEPNYLPLLAGLLIITVSATFALGRRYSWVRK